MEEFLLIDVNKFEMLCNRAASARKDHEAWLMGEVKINPKSINYRTLKRRNVIWVIL